MISVMNKIMNKYLIKNYTHTLKGNNIYAYGDDIMKQIISGRDIYNYN